MNEPLDRRVYVIAGIVTLGSLMSILDTTIVNVALDTLARDLDATLTTIQWVATGYLVALSIVIPLTGWASERFGARRLWLTVVMLFAAGSALCGLAWNADSLIAFRVVQGLGGGMIMPAGMTIVAQAAGPKRMGRVMSVVGVPMLMGPILGPVLGGVIVSSLSWRWIFYVNVPFAILAVVLALRMMPPSKPRHAERLDLRGFTILSPGLALLVFGLSESAEHGGFGAPVALGPMVVGLLLIGAFTRHALRVTNRQPLLDLRLLASRGFAAAGATVFFISATMLGTLLLLPLYLQVARGQSTLVTGLLLAPQGVGALLCMPISGRLTDRVGGGRVVIVGLTIMTLSTIGLTFLSATTSYVALGALLVVRGIGFGASLMPAQAAALATVSQASIPRATTALNVMQRVGGSLGTALLAVILAGRLDAAVPSASGTTGAAIGTLPSSVREHYAVPLAHAFAQTFWWTAGMTALALVPGAVLAVTAVRGRQRDAPTALPT